MFTDQGENLKIEHTSKTQDTSTKNDTTTRSRSKNSGTAATHVIDKINRTMRNDEKGTQIPRKYKFLFLIPALYLFPGNKYYAMPIFLIHSSCCFQIIVKNMASKAYTKIDPTQYLNPENQEM